LAWKLEAVLLTAVFSAKTIVPQSGHEEMKLALVQQSIDRAYRVE
jgi:hypothetical protein